MHCVWVPVLCRCHVTHILLCDVFQVVIQRWHVVCGVDYDMVLVMVEGVWVVVVWPRIVALAFHFPPPGFDLLFYCLGLVL